MVDCVDYCQANLRTRHDLPPEDWYGWEASGLLERIDEDIRAREMVDEYLSQAGCVMYPLDSDFLGVA